MIEWIPFNPENPPESKRDNFYLVANKMAVGIAYYEDQPFYGKHWFDENREIFRVVTHYAVINLPGEEEA